VGDRLVGDVVVVEEMNLSLEMLSGLFTVECPVSELPSCELVGKTAASVVLFFVV